MLATTDMSVARISETLKFADDGYFIKQFKKYEGVTPLVYRKSVKR